MQRRARRALLAIFLLLGAFVLAALLEPSQTVRAFFAGEDFYHLRPTRHWRQLLREQSQAERISDDVARELSHDPAAIPVLLHCARDPDGDVRSLAIVLLRRGRWRTQPILEALTEALADEATEVRLQAISTLAAWGPMARPALPDLATRLKDPELQVAHWADLALWEIDPSTAREATGWRTITSKELGISVALPGQPEREDSRLFGGQAIVHSLQAWHRVGAEPAPTRYVAMVIEYAEGSLQGSTEEERYRAATELAPAFFQGGKVVEVKEVVLEGRQGREQLISVEGKGCVRNRSFWVGQRLFVVFIAYQPKFLNARAADYFLDSLRLSGG